MIEVNCVSKNFDDVCALKEVSAKIEEGKVFGLIGTNGAGKSTLLRIMCGILRPDFGCVLVDGKDIYENAMVSEDVFYISDDQYFPNDTPEDLMKFYKGFYPYYSEEKFRQLIDYFELPMKRKAKTFSKGMKKQLYVALGISACTKYLLCDETFDGLDPIMREKVKKIFRADMEVRALTPVIASHSLRELEDICENVGMLHKGGMIFSRDEIDEMIQGEMSLEDVFLSGYKKTAAANEEGKNEQ